MTARIRTADIRLRLRLGDDFRLEPEAVRALLDAVEAAHKEVTSGYHGTDYLVELIEALNRFDFGDAA